MLDQSLNSIHEKSSDDNTIRDNRTLHHMISRKELSEASSKEKENVKVNDENIRCKDTILSTKDDFYCKDTDSMDFQQDSYSTVPCSSFSTCNNIKYPQSCITIYPSEARARLDDSDVFLSRAIYTNVERRNYCRNNDRDNVHGDDSECTVCHAVDGSLWLTKSIYTDCATYSEDPKECFTDNYKYRNKILQNSVINRNDIRNRQMEYKLLQQPLGSYQRKEMVRQRSMCSCIAEEEEDYCKGVDRVEKKLPENVCNSAECLEEIFVCQTPSRKLAKSVAVCKTSFDAPGKPFETTRTCKDSTKCSEGTSMRGTRFGNSEEPPKVTRVCKEFVIEEPPEDITVCKTMFGEPNGLPGEVIVYKTAFPKSKDTLKETMCKEIPDPNFANQDDVNRVSLSDAKDKLVKESTNSTNLNGPKQNAGNKRIVKLNNKHDNVILNNFTEQQSANIKQDEQIKETLNDQLKNLYQIPVKSIKDSKRLLENVYVTTLSPAQLYDRPNLVSNPNEKKTSKTIVNQRKTIRTQLLNQSTRNRFHQSNDLTQYLTSNKNNQLEEKMQENSKEKEEKQDISKEMETIEDKQKESLLHRPFKKLFDVIKRGRTFITDRIETGEIETKKTIANGKNEKSEIASETEDKTGDIKDQQEITEKVVVPMKPSQMEIANKGKL